jgi:CheY-like chemotaxis protein
VLLVEDDNEVAALAEEMLEQLGFEVIRVASAKAALGALSNGRSIDLVFSDVMMPGGMNGIELAREIRSRRRDLPVILTSGYPDAARLQAEAAGVRIIPKPFRLDELSAALPRLGRKA